MEYAAGSWEQTLVAAQHADGGWGYGASGSWTEPTALAVLALGASSNEGRRGIDWLTRVQRADGGTAPHASVAESSWVTALALLVDHSTGDAGRAGGARAWLLEQGRPRDDTGGALAALAARHNFARAGFAGLALVPLDGWVGGAHGGDAGGAEAEHRERGCRGGAGGWAQGGRLSALSRGIKGRAGITVRSACLTSKARRPTRRRTGLRAGWGCRRGARASPSS